MSYDVYLKINTGKEMTTVVDVGNYTSNIGGMYQKAFSGDLQSQKEAHGIRCIHDMKASDAAPYIQLAIVEMEDDPDDYKSMNPANGWGNYEGALKYLKDILQACEDHPECIIDVSV